MRALLLALCASLACPVSADPPRKSTKHERKAKPCKRTKYRYIGTERVPWDHDEDDHEWDEFDHTTDECAPPPC